MLTHALRRLQPPLTATLLLASASSLCAQRTWTVRASGGADFTDLPPAVAAASPGDTIRLYGEPGGIYSSTTFTRGIALVGIPSGPPLAFPPVVRELVVRGIPAGESMRIARITILSSSPGVAIQLTQCDGPVVIDQLTHGAMQMETVEIHRCRQVVVRQSSLGARDAPVRIIDSRVVLNGCDVRTITGTATGPAGIRVVRSELDLVDTDVSATTASFLPRVVLRLDASRVRLSVGCTLSNGPAVFPELQAACGGSPSIVLAPPGHGYLTAGCVTVIPEHVPSITAGTAVRGSTLGWRSDGTLGSVHLVVAGLLLTSGPLPVPFGDLWLQPFGPLEYVGWVLADATGTGSGTLSIPASLPLGTAIAMQSIELDANGAGGELSLPSVAVVQ